MPSQRMVLWRQCHHSAGRLGHAIGLDEVGLKHFQALAQQFQRHWRSTVDDVAQIAEIHGLAARIAHHHLQRSRHGEQTGDALAGNGVKDRTGFELGQDHCRYPRSQGHRSQPGSADVGARHGD